MITNIYNFEKKDVNGFMDQIWVEFGSQMCGLTPEGHGSKSDPNP